MLIGNSTNSVVQYTRRDICILAKVLQCFTLFVYKFGCWINKLIRLYSKNTSSENYFERKMEVAQKRIPRAISFGKRYESMIDSLVKHNVFTVFELYMIEIVEEFSKQVRAEAPFNYFEKPTATKTALLAIERKGFFVRLMLER